MSKNIYLGKNLPPRSLHLQTVEYRQQTLFPALCETFIKLFHYTFIFKQLLEGKNDLTFGPDFSKFCGEVGDNTNPSNQMMVVLSHGPRHPFLLMAIATLARVALLDRSAAWNYSLPGREKMEQKNPCSAKIPSIGAIQYNTIKIIHP